MKGISPGLPPVVEISIQDSFEARVSWRHHPETGRCCLHFRSDSYSSFLPLPLPLLEASQDRWLSGGTGRGDVMVQRGGQWFLGGWSPRPVEGGFGERPAPWFGRGWTENVSHAHTWKCTSLWDAPLPARRLCLLPQPQGLLRFPPTRAPCSKLKSQTLPSSPPAVPPKQSLLASLSSAPLFAFYLCLLFYNLFFELSSHFLAFFSLRETMLSVTSLRLEGIFVWTLHLSLFFLSLRDNSLWWILRFLYLRFLMLLSSPMPDPPSLPPFWEKCAHIFIICFLSGCCPSLRTASSLLKEARGDLGLGVSGGGASWTSIWFSDALIESAIHTLSWVCAWS